MAAVQRRLDRRAKLCGLAALAALAAAPAAAQTFPVHLNQDLGDLKIIAQARSADAAGDIMVLSLTNLDQRNARCEATFDIRVLPPKTYQRDVAAGERVQIHHRVKRSVNRMTIDLDCAPAD
jgi:hypothetical protein